MQEKHPIDNYFKENLKLDFPLTSSSKKRAGLYINSFLVRKYVIIFSLAALFLMGATGLFLAFYTGNKPEIKMTGKNSVKNEMNKKTDRSLDYLKPEDSEPLGSNKVETNNFSDKKLNPKTNDEIKKPDVKPEIPVKENTEIIAPIEDVPISNLNKEPEIELANYEKMVFTDIDLFSKPFHAFSFDNTNKNPQPNFNYLEKKKKKFAFAIEFEEIFSNQVKHELGKLSQAETEYRKKHETGINTNGYAINFMFQRGGIALITGLGYQSTMMKTNYVDKKISFNILTTFKYLDDSVKASSGYYQLVRVRKDTSARFSEEVIIEDQPPHNRFEWIQVPVKISYQYPINRLRFSLRAGADLMWLYNTGGSFINKDLNGLTVIGEGDQKLKPFNVNASAQFIAGYQFNRSLQAGGSIYYARQLGSNFSSYSSSFRGPGLGLYLRIGI